MRWSVAFASLVAGIVIGADGVAYAQCPSTTGCAFEPVPGINPDTAGWNELFELSAQNQLGERSPELPQIEIGPDRILSPPSVACAIMKPIAAAESTWLQFCPDTGLTVISFDCGHGVTQVTSGADGYGPKLASDAAWNVGAGMEILITKWNGEFRGGPIGNADPLILENWYYAVWAYNGFVFGNNPDNPQLPPNRPPFGGPNSLSRRNYPYQEIVWGYMHFPLDWRTTPRWEAVPVTYPAPGQVGMDPGPLPALIPEHRSECKEPCTEEMCDWELIIDDLDDQFVFQGNGETEPMGGFQGGFQVAPSAADSNATGVWTFQVPIDRIYDVSVYVPVSNRASTIRAPATLVARGRSVRGLVDQTRGQGAFTPLATVKLLEGVTYEVVVSNGTGESGAEIAFDAVRIAAKAPLATKVEGDPCLRALECAGALVCVAGRCVPGCDDRGCSEGVCEPISGLCTGESPGGGIDAGIIDAGQVDTPGDAADAGTGSMPPAEEDGCGCSVGQTRPKSGAGAWAMIGILALALVARRDQLRS